MEEGQARHQRSTRVSVGVLFLLVFNNASSSQVFVCSPSNISDPLECNDRQWIRILAETYAPQTDVLGPACQQDISSCNTYFHDTGMQVNCNGPAWQGGAGCREEVNVDEARGLSKCLQNVHDVATLVQYDCIEGSEVLNLCLAKATLTTSDLSLYLASPGYPQSTPQGKFCTCTIQGSNLKINAVEIDIRSKLPWDDGTTDEGIYNSVFSVTSGNDVLWRSNNCAACTTNNLVNTNLFLPVDDTKYQNVTISYSDFGLTGQNVWVQVFELGPSLDVSCSSSLLPPERIVTTTTSTTTVTTLVTTADRSIPIIATTKTPPASTTGSPVKTTMSKPPIPTETPSRTSDRPTSPAESEGLFSGNDKSDSNDSAVLIVTLTVLLFALVVAAAVLGVMIYRKRHNFNSDDFISPCNLITSWYQRTFHKRQHTCSSEEDCVNNGSFDAIVLQGEPGRPHTQGDVPDKHIDNEDERVQHSGTTCAVSADPNQHLEGRGCTQNVEDFSSNGDDSLFPAALYQYHQQLLDEELAKMRRDRSSRVNISETNFSAQSSDSKSNAEAEDMLRKADAVRTETCKKKNHEATAKFSTSKEPPSEDISSNNSMPHHVYKDDSCNGDSLPVHRTLSDEYSRVSLDYDSNSHAEV